jgi:uncharacterized protein (DUF4415 family)
MSFRRDLSKVYSEKSLAESKVTVTIDRDVLEWFQAQGDRADLQMALALKIYAEANKAYEIVGEEHNVGNRNQ